MNRMLTCLLVALLTATWLGCQVQTGTEATSGGAAADGLTLVSLKVPNMT
ncbi:MAG: hypothetical protein J5I93_02900 [Pirellulaceae bacterium]|nr:hypothetical protein [Pirellulaceae bacterium]